MRPSAGRFFFLWVGLAYELLLRIPARLPSFSSCSHAVRAKCTKKRAARAELLFCLFMTFSLPPPLWHLLNSLMGRERCDRQNMTYLPISRLLRSMIDGPNKI